MAAAPHPSAAAGLEHHGPLDRRAIGPEDIDPLSHDFAARLRAHKANEGHRAAVVASLAAILAGVAVLSDLGGEPTVISALQQHIATAERRMAERAAGAQRGTLQ